MEKLKYLFWAGLHYYSSIKCPACSNTQTKVVDTKYFFTRLLECSNCKILFRHPVDNPDFNKKFYQRQYRQDNCLVTNLPNDDELKKMLENNFIETDRNADRIYNIIKMLFQEKELKHLKMIDYGSSWGYISYQLLQKGLEVQSFEISETRALFGNNKLKLDIKTMEKELNDGNDIFFSSHVIEHHPNPTEMINSAKKLLNENGYFICYCPNGSEEYLHRDKESFHLAWGLVHPFYINKNYFAQQFNDTPYYIDSGFNPAGIKKMINNEQFVGDLSNGELLVISKPNFKIKNDHNN
jgi:2-polyprenyl-3-methyl-5-hydroxy-6-metoxy-1,4-benzoquinol methylase